MRLFGHRSSLQRLAALEWAACDLQARALYMRELILFARRCAGRLGLSWCSLSKGGAVCEGLGYLAGALQLVNIINKGAAGVYWENQLGGFVGPAPAVAVAAAR